MSQGSITEFSSDVIGSMPQMSGTQNPRSGSESSPTDPSKIVQPGRATAAESLRTRRNPSLDFTKGSLILIMVLYHWLNYFIGPAGYMYRYLRFLTPSFIFLTGFLISYVYLSTYDIKDPRLPQRLLQRGFKLFGILVILNMSVGILSSGTPHSLRDFSWSTIASAYITGNTAAGKLVVFSVLAPISYLLILSAGLLVLARRYRNIFHVVCIFSFLCILALALCGIEIANLELVAIGLFGVSVGYVSMDRINGILRHTHVLALAYVTYAGAISIWNEVYPLQVIGVCLSLALLYRLGSSNTEPGEIRRIVILLGRYSLLGYIAQIAILHILRRSLLSINLGFAELGISFFAAVALTVVSVALVDRARTRTKIVNRLYGAVFA